MPFRTRDFLLFLLVVIFLIIAITATVWRDVSGDFITETIDFSEIDESVVYEASLADNLPDKRPERLKSLREKIAKLGNIQTISNTPTEEENVEEESSSDDVTEDVVIGEIDYCDNYTKSITTWSPNNLKFEVVEGARIIHRGNDLDNLPAISTSSAPKVINTVLQLPLRTAPVSVRSCIATDVVGVALDGSLIRNEEYTIYSIFGSETLIGYALDGFPIYGSQTDVQTDVCGGRIDLEQYKYYLSSEREGVLGCYSGVPVKF